MRKLILAGLTIVLLGGAGFAYAANATSTVASTVDTSGVTRLADAGSPPPPPPGGPDHTDWGPGGPGHHGPRGDMPPPPPPSKAAHFRIERGPFSIDVKCADDDSTKDCAAVALQLIDKAAALPMPPAPPAPQGQPAQ